MKATGFKYKTHKKSYYVDRHEDEDVVEYRTTYIDDFFKSEVYEHCWIQLSKKQYLSLKVRNELRTIEVKKEKDIKLSGNITEKMTTYIEEQRIYSYQDGEEKEDMVELHVDDYYGYDDVDKTILPRYGGNVSVRLPVGSKPRLCFGQDEAIFHSSQLNESCWTVDDEATLRTKGLGTGVMVSAMVSRATGFGLQITDEQLLEINKLRLNKSYVDAEAATYLRGSSTKKPLKESPFIIYLDYGSGKDGYWTYRHMVLQIEDCVDCLTFIFPQFDYEFELDHSSGHNSERPDGLSTTSSVINLGWGGKQRKMRSSILSADDIGPLRHARTIPVGSSQSMVFSDDDIPPIFDPTAPKYDQPVQGQNITRSLNKGELEKKLKDAGLNSDGNAKALKIRAVEANIPIEVTTPKVIPGYVGKAKGAAQIAAERGFIGLDGLLSNGKKYSMNGTSTKDPVTKVVTMNRDTSVIRILQRCNDFKNEKTQLMFILDLLNVTLILTPKCHPEIAGRGVEYCWGYAKLRFRRDFNDAIAKNLKANTMKSLDRDVITTNRVRKFARKTREYKSTYALLIHIAGGKDATARKDDIEHITKLFKAHRSAMDADYGFIASA